MTDYLWPVPAGTPISQPFGSNPGGFNPAGGHTGTDFAASPNTPVRAPSAGVIKHADWFSDTSGSDNPWWLTPMGGITVVLDAGPVVFVFAHLNRTNLNRGDKVKQGDIIGYSGNTGTATTGAHLHFEAMPDGWDFQNGTYGRVDPARYCTGYYTALKPPTVTPQSTSKPTPIKEADMPITDADADKIANAILNKTFKRADGSTNKLIWLLSSAEKMFDENATKSGQRAAAEIRKQGK